jgi:hypothetical protein
MLSMIDFILDLFRDQNHAAAFVADPERAMADAGLSAVTSAQLASVAATAVPSLALGDGDPIVGLQRAVSNHYGFQGFDPNSAPPTWAPSWAPQPDFSPSTDMASGNSILSPTTNIRDDHSFNLDFGDITLGDKTSAQGPGAVAIGGSNHGDIVSGEGAVLGNGNSVNNGDIRTGSHSNVAVGDHNGISEGNTAAGGDVLTSHDGTVIQTSGHGTTANSEGNVTSVHGNQTTTDIHGAGNTSGVDNSSTVVHTSTTTDNSVHDNSVYSPVHSMSVVDSSVHDISVHDNTSSYAGSVHNNTSMHETTHQNTGIETHLGF